MSSCQKRAKSNFSQISETENSEAEIIYLNNERDCPQHDEYLTYKKQNKNKQNILNFCY